MITGSVYLPHKYLQRFIKECFLPLFKHIEDRHQARLINYHLSTYKGENISFQFELPNDKNSEFVKDILVRVLGSFIKKMSLKSLPQTLPLNELFLNIPEGSIHIWDINPFRTKHLFQSEPPVEEKIRSLVSRQCLNFIREIENIHNDLLFRSYLELMINIQDIIQGINQEKYTDIPSRIINRLKKRKGIGSRISLLENRILKFYGEKKAGMNKEIDHIIKINTGSNHDNVLPDEDTWKRFLYEIDGLCPSMTLDERSDFYLNLITDITQKLSLNIESLVKAAVILREYKK